MSAVRVWTVGHSTREVHQLLELLGCVPIVRLVDVRTVPRSRRNPQFDKDSLAWELERAGIVYRHAPQLGGLRKPLAESINTGLVDDGFRGYADHMQSEAFGIAVEELFREAGSGNTVVMCAEASPWHCHRTLLADGLVARGVDVVHLVAPGRTETHRVHPLARVRGREVTYPGLL